MRFYGTFVFYVECDALSGHNSQEFVSKERGFGNWPKGSRLQLPKKRIPSVFLEMHLSLME